MVKVIDRVLSQNLGDLCSCLIMDGEGCNQMVLKIIHGDIDSDMQIKVEKLGFFRKVRHAPIPLDWPRLPIKLCLVDGDPFFGLVGPADTMKNAAGQLQSPIRILYYGEYFADCAGMLQHGVPWPAFQRRDAMSDRLCSLLASPQFLISPVDPGTCWQHFG